VPGAIEVLGAALGGFIVAPPVVFPPVAVPGAGLAVVPPAPWLFIALGSVVLPPVVLLAPLVASGVVEPEVVLPTPSPDAGVGEGSGVALAVFSVAVVPVSVVASVLLPRSVYQSAPAIAKATIAANSQVFPPDFSPSKRGTGILLTK
jgi:hypothetical protein